MRVRSVLALCTGAFFVGVLVAALVLSLSHVPPRSHSRTERARLQVHDYAFEAYPSWRAAHPGRACPRSLRELDAYMGGHAPDPWGSPLEFRCGRMLPRGASGLWVRSAGADRRFGTDDDLVSSE